MKIFNLVAVVLGASLWLVNPALFAGEVDELREQVEILRKQLGAMEERTRHDSEKSLENTEGVSKRISGRPNQFPGQGGGRPRGLEPNIRQLPNIRELKERQQDLERKVAAMREANASEQDFEIVRGQQAAIEREIAQAQRAHRGGQGGGADLGGPEGVKLDAQVRRIHHLRVAAENLKQAQVHDLAHDLMEKANGIEREVRAARIRLAEETYRLRGPGQELPPAPRATIRELQTENERLRAELNELRQQRPNP